VQVNAFKVLTERGNVYLMGRVTEREADRAAYISRGVSGVLKVVKVFEVVSEASSPACRPRRRRRPPPPSPDDGPRLSR
jgi:hypothetical protein